MGDLILAGVLTWAIILAWWGTDLLLRADQRRGKLMGGILVALAPVPAIIALWLGT